MNEDVTSYFSVLLDLRYFLGVHLLMWASLE